jgi:hypothetical protein
MALSNASHSLAIPSPGTNALRDIKPPVDIPSGWTWVWAAVIAAIVVALAIFLWKRWRKMREEIPAEPPVPAHLRARRLLEQALGLLDRPKEFCVLVSDTARFYLEERFDFRAPERTTEEFLHELSGTDLLTRDQKESLGEFLQQCDLVKFARYEPGEPELRALHAAAVRLVDETEPVALKPAGGAPAAPAPAASSQ